MCTVGLAVKRRVKLILIRHATMYHEPDDVGDDLPVFGPGGVIEDSLEILESLFEIEAALGIAIPDEDLTEDLFRSVERFSEYVARLADSTPDPQ